VSRYLLCEGLTGQRGKEATMGETESADETSAAAEPPAAAPADQPTADSDDTKPAAVPGTMFQGAKPDE